MSVQPTVLIATATSLEKAMKVFAAWDQKDQHFEELRDDEARESSDAFQADKGILDDAIAAASLEDVAKEGAFSNFSRNLLIACHWVKGVMFFSD